MFRCFCRSSDAILATLRPTRRHQRRALQCLATLCPAPQWTVMFRKFMIVKPPSTIATKLKAVLLTLSVGTLAFAHIRSHRLTNDRMTVQVRDCKLSVKWWFPIHIGSGWNPSLKLRDSGRWGPMHIYQAGYQDHHTIMAWHCHVCSADQGPTTAQRNWRCLGSSYLCMIYTYM